MFVYTLWFICLGLGRPELPSNHPGVSADLST